MITVRMLGAAAVLLLGCGDSSPTTSDAESDAVVDVGTDGGCASDDACSDGLFCNGEERCAPDDPLAGVDGCIVGASPCASAFCDDSRDLCTETDCEQNADADGDGERSVACGGADCDDEDPNRFPGATEICDANDRDEDCDPTTFGFRDADNDAFPDALCCNVSDDGVRRCGDDCNDSRPNVNVAASEVCDGFDNDCDEQTDEGVLQRFYVDADGDTFGDETMPQIEACFAPMGYSAMGRDCDDGDEDRNPGRPELCDAAMVDENCDGTANPAMLCMCSGDISRMCSLPGACAAGTERCVAGSWGACSIAPVGETCNSFDDDCDGTVDEGVAVTCYVDDDDDGYPSGLDTAAYLRCPQPGRAAVGGCPVLFTNRVPFGADIDCDDTAASVNSGATEICDAAMVDENCDGMANPDPPCECSGTGTQACPLPGVCSSGTQTCVDGRWSACSILPTSEVCDGTDEDCDGAVDEGTTLCRGPDSYQVCAGGGCAVVGCVDGFGNCDGDITNGCEENLDTSVSACGSCGVSCVPGSECMSGVCSRPIGIAASYRSTCVLWSGGTVSCWGDNIHGQLGDGTQTNRASPVAVAGLTDAIAVEGGAGHFCAIRSGGTVVCWGDNGSGQLGDPSLPEARFRSRWRA
ncbi:MAG: MopE-related protein [Myxococcota bacterium]